MTGDNIIKDITTLVQNETSLSITQLSSSSQDSEYLDSSINNNLEKKIILIDGISSSGKTSIVKLFDNSYKKIIMDDYQEIGEKKHLMK